MSYYVSAIRATGGYQVGPTLPPGEAPWPVGWEQDPAIDDGHRHEWETVLLGATERQRVEEVVRCRICCAPRCGHSTDPDPCMERRHHRSCHRLLSGRRVHLGGIATGCDCR